MWKRTVKSIQEHPRIMSSSTESPEKKRSATGQNTPRFTPQPPPTPPPASARSAQPTAKASPMIATPKFTMAPPTTPPPSKSAPQQGRPRVSKVSFGQAMTQKVKHGILVPRVGGVIQSDKTGEAFTGGSNIQDSPPLPVHSLQRRPLKMSDQQMFVTACKAGVQNKLAAVDS